MGKGANKTLLNNAGMGQSLSKQTAGRGQQDWNFLFPQLESEAISPQGYTPQQLAYINTANQQSLGGGAAATTGQANLEAARTRNAGGFQSGIGEANRSARRQLSQNALGVQEKQANLQQAQRQTALQQLMQLYGMNEQEAAAFLNSSNTALHDENQSHPLQEGFRTFADVLSSLTGAAKTGAEIDQQATST